MAGAAYMRLLSDGVLPAWAMFCYADFKGLEPSHAEAGTVAMISEHFILLAPVEIDGGYQGLMLAENVVSGQHVEVEFYEQKMVVSVPLFDDYVIAKGDVEVDLVRPPVETHA